MEKKIILRNAAKKIYTKLEIKYITLKGYKYITFSGVPVGCKYHLGFNYVFVRNDHQEKSLFAAMQKRAKVLRKKFPDLEEWEAEMKRKAAAFAKLEKEINKITKQLIADGFRPYYPGACPGTVKWDVINTLNTGKNVGNISVMYSEKNGITVDEEKYYNGYSKSFQYPMIKRNFSIELKKGYHLFRIGGILTFVRGSKIIRNGMACEWIVQGRAIADIKTVKGYIVKGEHIEAKSLRQAQDINKRNRQKQLNLLLKIRRESEKENEKLCCLNITYEDSIAAGNCHAGTQAFKSRLEAAIGRPAESINGKELMKYAKKFGVERYANRVIRYLTAKKI